MRQFSILQLTYAVSLAAIIALLTRHRLFVELVYFWAFSASLQAVLTPDLGFAFPSVFHFTYFLYHVGTIVAACLLVFGCRLYPHPGAMTIVRDRSYGIPHIYGTTRAEVMFGAGYAGAEDRLFLMDVLHHAGANWSGEAILDIEWAYAIAPEAHLVLLAAPVAETEAVQGFPSPDGEFAISRSATSGQPAVRVDRPLASIRALLWQSVLHSEAELEPYLVMVDFALGAEVAT